MSGSAREMKVGLDSKSGFSKFHHAREYRRAARDAYRFAKVAFRILTFLTDVLFPL
jgi:hypothetical protein